MLKAFMKKLSVVCFSILILTACFNTAKLENQKADTIAKLSNKKLMHIVYLKTKDNLDELALIEIKTQLQSLAEISGVIDLTVGTKAKTNDNRHFENYNLALQMKFNSIDDLNVYAINEYHLKVRESIKPVLTAPPIVFDYWIEE